MLKPPPPMAKIVGLGDKRHRRPQVLGRQRRSRPPRRPPPPRGRRPRFGPRAHHAREPRPDEVQRRPVVGAPSPEPSPPRSPPGSPGAAAAPCRSARRWSPSAGRAPPPAAPARRGTRSAPARTSTASRRSARTCTTPRAHACAQHVVEPVRAPRAQHRAHAAAADVDQVLLEQVRGAAPARRSRAGTATRATARSATPGSAGRSGRCSGPRHPTRSGGSTPSGARPPWRPARSRRAARCRTPWRSRHHRTPRPEGRATWLEYAARNGASERISSSGRTRYGPRVESSVARDPPMPRAWTSASQRSSPRCRTPSTSPRASRWATPCARARSACGSARRSGSTTTQRSSLFYALLLKDAGCSSNAAKLSALFGADDFELKRARKLTNHLRPFEALRYTRPPRPHAPAGRDRPQRRRGRPRHDRAALRARRRDRAHDRADRGDRRGDPTLDEHWDGNGYPYGLAGDAIPLLGRIVCLAQTVEVFFAAAGPRAVFDVAAERRGTWFDPTLVDALRATRRDRAFWSSLGGHEPHAVIGAFEPADRVQHADGERLDRVAEAFALIIDAKSPYTGTPLRRRRPHRGLDRRRARPRPARAARPPPRRRCCTTSASSASRT